MRLSVDGYASLTNATTASPLPISCKATKTRFTHCWTRHTRQKPAPIRQTKISIKTTASESKTCTNKPVTSSSRRTGGLVFSYPPYAGAPFVAGQVELTLPYAQLRGIIKDAYLPQ